MPKKLHKAPFTSTKDQGLAGAFKSILSSKTRKELGDYALDTSKSYGKEMLKNFEHKDKLIANIKSCSEGKQKRFALAKIAVKEVHDDLRKKLKKNPTFKRQFLPAFKIKYPKFYQVLNDKTLKYWLNKLNNGMKI